MVFRSRLRFPLSLKALELSGLGAAPASRPQGASGSHRAVCLFHGLVALRPPPLDHGALEGGPRLARSSSRAAQCRHVAVCVSGQGRRPPGFSLPSTRAPWSLSREGTSLPAIPPHTCQSPLCGENPLDSDASRKSTSALCWEMKMLKENYVFHRQSKSFFSLLSVWIRGSLFLWEHLNFPVF